MKVINRYIWIFLILLTSCVSPPEGAGIHILDYKVINNYELNQYALNSFVERELKSYGSQYFIVLRIKFTFDFAKYLRKASGIPNINLSTNGKELIASPLLHNKKVVPESFIKDEYHSSASDIYTVITPMIFDEVSGLFRLITNNELDLNEEVITKDVTELQIKVSGGYPLPFYDFGPEDFSLYTSDLHDLTKVPQ